MSPCWGLKSSIALGNEILKGGGGGGGRPHPLSTITNHPKTRPTNIPPKGRTTLQARRDHHNRVLGRVPDRSGVHLVVL